MYVISVRTKIYYGISTMYSLTSTRYQFPDVIGWVYVFIAGYVRVEYLDTGIRCFVIANGFASGCPLSTILCTFHFRCITKTVQKHIRLDIFILNCLSHYDCLSPSVFKISTFFVFFVCL